MFVELLELAIDENSFVFIDLAFRQNPKAQDWHHRIRYGDGTLCSILHRACSCLHAASSDRVGIVSCLVTAHPSLQFALDEWNQTPISVALSQGGGSHVVTGVILTLAEQLKSRDDVDRAFPDTIPLDWYARLPATIVTLLIECGATLIDRDQQNWYEANLLYVGISQDINYLLDAIATGLREPKVNVDAAHALTDGTDENSPPLLVSLQKRKHKHAITLLAMLFTALTQDSRVWTPTRLETLFQMAISQSL